MVGLLNQAGGQAPAPQDPNMRAQNMEQGGGDDFQDPALQRAINYIGTRLYGEDKVSIEIAQKLDNAQVAMPKIIATIAYTLAQAADEATDGMILEENLSILGMLALNEIFTIAEQAGMPLESKDVSAAMKQMIVMYGQDNGLTQQEIEVLAQNMAQIDDAQFAAEAAEMPDDFGDTIPDVPVDDENPQMSGQQMGA